MVRGQDLPYQRKGLGPGTMAADMGGTHPELGPHVLVKVWSAEGGRFTLVSSGSVPSHVLASNNIPDLQFKSSPPPLHFPHYTFQYPKTQPTSPQSGSLGPLSKPALTFPLLPSIFPPNPSPLPTRLPLTTPTHTQQETKGALMDTPLPYDSLNTKKLLEVLKLKLLTQDSSQDRPQNHAHPWHLDGGITQSPVMSSTLSQGAQVTERPAYGSLSDPPRLGDPLNQTDFSHKPVLIVRGQHFSPSDVDEMESEHQAGISSWTPSGPSSGEPAWEDLLQPSYLEALFADLDMEDPHIRRILRTLAMIYIVAINPHLHILNLQDNHNESLSSAQVSTSHLSSTTKPVTLNSFNPEQEGNKSALINEVFLPHSILQKNNFRSPYQAEVTSSTGSLKDDSFFSRIEATVPADSSTSSGSSGLTTEKSRMEECLKKTWCALGMALTMAAGTTSAVAVPLMMPLMGRRRKKLPFAPLSRRGPHLAPRLSLAINTDSRLRRSPNTMLAATLRRMTSHNHKNYLPALYPIIQFAKLIHLVFRRAFR
ncbi:hypothetical protein E2C01_023215 [Portunus trituberculatus]|uniref:Uncharacterized protein n=1 Tax=Portunus trituberculatus TaxID=210409 RepID=A0A5B7E7F2_PORTR|nr:hypothetical protein [Portunus trituberculatus]